jgi:Holliday junction DNA helicase RuvA
MITFLQGKVVEKQPTRVVVDVNGVGYEVFIPLSSFDRLPSAGDPCRILTYDHIREDLHQLFGFMTEPERQLFLLLMSTSGVGPKIALAALSGMSVREIKSAIVQGDVKRLSSISGIGKKLAERIVLELKDKIGEADALAAMAGAEPATPEDLRTRDAVMALIALGYRQDDARKMIAEAVRGAKGDMTVEDVVRKALGNP